MHKHFRVSVWAALLSASSFTVHAQQPSPAAIPDLCPVPIPLFDASIKPLSNLPQGAIGVRANHAEIDSETQVASFFGDVEVQLDQQQLTTDQAQINQQSGNINARGATRFTDGYVQVASENFQLNSGDNQALLSGARYQLAQSGAHGKADLLYLSPQQVLLQGATFTTCPSENPAWQMSAQEISLSEDEEWGEAWHAKFELFGVPVMYIPYINFPVTDARKSGFLFPTFRSSQKNGFEVETPYYINIAPNMDATITPRYMDERGLQMQGEFRFISTAGSGQYNLAYLDNDDSLTTDNSRFLWRIEQSHAWNDHWRGYVNGVFISDDDYLNDLGSEFAGRADSQIYRHAQLNYRSEDWQVTMRAEDFELLGNYRSPYRTVPQIQSHYNYNSALNLDVNLFTELSHFRNQDDSSDATTRVHIEPQ